MGLILIIIAGVLSVPAPVSLFFSEYSLIPYFLIPAAICLVLGFLFYKKYEREDIVFGKAMVLVATTWLILAFLGAIPYIFGHNMGIIESIFESMSGFTATGLTVLQGEAGWIGSVPESTILFWRSFTQWIGGLGVIVLFLAVFIGTGKLARKLYASEAREDRIYPSIRDTARFLWKSYSVFTIAGILGFVLTGMGIFAAINHSMTAIATGGFTVTPDSFAGYGIPSYVVAFGLMTAGGISFAVHRKAWDKDWRELFRSIEVRLMFAFIIIASVALFWSIGLRHAIFQSTSALTGTGFSSTGLIPSSWGAFQRGVLTVLMVVGGGYGSTSSAIKLIRTIIIISAVAWLLKRSFLPDRAVVPLEIRGETYAKEDVMEASLYGFIYIMLLTAGSLIVMLAMPDWSGMDVIFETASAQGNVGLSVGITAVSPPVVKIVYIIQMLAGRLEILPVVALFRIFIEKIPRRREPF